ncbi:hypothetical protein B0H10DRAFT_2221679 [Mycena sp. CBHHK59/15]|nr:hypothetical protein B0H10DRAFT_2221679 [Mycena sp. CBHHK59/15]
MEPREMERHLTSLCHNYKTASIRIMKPSDVLAGELKARKISQATQRAPTQPTARGAPYPRFGAAGNMDADPSTTRSTRPACAALTTTPRAPDTPPSPTPRPGGSNALAPEMASETDSDDYWGAENFDSALLNGMRNSPAIPPPIPFHSRPSGDTSSEEGSDVVMESRGGSPKDTPPKPEANIHLGNEKVEDGDTSAYSLEYLTPPGWAARKLAPAIAVPETPKQRVRSASAHRDPSPTEPPAMEVDPPSPIWDGRAVGMHRLSTQPSHVTRDDDSDDDMREADEAGSAVGSVSGSSTAAIPPYPSTPDRAPVLTDGPTDFSVLITKAPLRDFDLAIDPHNRTMLCFECGSCWCPDEIRQHVKKHGLHMTAAECLDVRALCLENGVSNTRGIVDFPAFGNAPVEGLRIHDGFYCEEHQYACRAAKAMQNHWSSEDSHRASGIAWRNGCKEGSVQTFFDPVPRRFFHVDPELVRGPRVSVVEAYNAAYGIKFDAPPQLIRKPTDFRERDPVENITRWGGFMAKFTETGDAVNALRSLFFLTDYRKRSPDGPDRLHEINIRYEEAIAKICNGATTTARMLLHRCPRVDVNSKIWNTHDNPVTVDRYNGLRERFAVAVLRAVDSNMQTTFKLPLTPSERAAAIAYGASLDAPRTTAETELLHYHRFISLFFLARNQPDAPETLDKFDFPFECVTALLAVREDGSMKPAYEMTQMLSQLKYIIRGTVLFEAKSRVEDFGGSLDKAILHVAQESIQLGMGSPFNITQEYQRIFSALVFRTPLPPVTLVNADDDTITYKDVTLSLPHLRQGLAAGVRELPALLADAMFGWDGPISYPAVPIDDWSCTSRRYSFFHNHKFVATRRPLMDHLLKDRELNLGRVDRSGNFTHNPIAVNKVLCRHDVFLHALMPILFMTSTMVRGTQFVELCIENGVRPRGLYVHGRDVFLVFDRSKVETVMDHAAFVPSLVCPALVDLLITYIVVLRPAIIELVSNTQGEAVANLYREYLWVSRGVRIESEQLSTLLSHFTERLCGTKTGLNPWRQLCVAILRYVDGPAAQLANQDKSDPWASFANHSTDARIANYGVLNLLPFLSSDVVDHHKILSIRWQTILGLTDNQPAPLPFQKAAKLLANGGTAGGNGNGPSTVDVMSAVTELFQNMEISMQLHIGKAITTSFARIMRDRRLDALPPSSPPVQTAPMKNHDAQGWDCETEPATSGLRGEETGRTREIHPLVVTIPHNENDPPAGSILRTLADSWSVTSKECSRLQAGLRKMLRDPNASFKSDAQRLAVEMAAAASENFVVYMPTGSGKSLIYQLTAYMENGKITIVICPNRSLLHDQCERAIALSLRVHVWTAPHPNPPDDTQLVFAALESATSKSFWTFLNLNLRRIPRMFFDEAHQILMDADFRPQFMRLIEFAGTDIQKILGSATGPPRLHTHLLTTVGLPPKMKVIRAPCLIPNVRIHVTRYDPDVTTAERYLFDVLNLLEKKLLRPEDQGIVFCGSRVDAATIGKRLGCFSHAGAPNREADEKAWLAGRARIMAATSTCAQGIDNARCRFTIFFNTGFGADTFIQGYGRNRCADECYAIVIESNRIHQKSFHARVDDVHGHAEMYRMLDIPTVCRRIPLAMFVDGTTASCRDIRGAVLCDVCEPEAFLVTALLAIVFDPFPDPRNRMDDDLDGDVGIFRNPGASWAGPSVEPHWKLDIQRAVATVPDVENARLQSNGAPAWTVGEYRAASSRELGNVAVNLNGDQPGSRSSSAYFPSSIAIPSSIVMDTADFAAARSMRAESARKLDDLVELLMGKCTVCWVFAEFVRERHHMTTFSGCIHQGKHVAAAYGGEFTKFSTAIRLPSHGEYCFRGLSGTSRPYSTT